MLTIYSSDHHLHRGVELKDGAITDSFENPLRARRCSRRCARRASATCSCRARSTACYAGAHSARYVEFLAGAWDEWTASGRSCQALPLVWPVRAMPSAAALPDFIDGKLGFFAMDAGAPINAGTWDAVRASANSALTAADLLSNGGARAAFARAGRPVIMRVANTWAVTAI
jgi:acetoin utilization deacetylase AcuC-like enzyme